MADFFTTLFNSENFMPHGHCYLWQSNVLWLNAGSDALIALSYFTIPGFLVYLVQKRKDLAFNWIFVMFALFIIACGTTHIFEIWTIWNPQYGLEGLMKLFTAGISLATAAALIPLMPKALSLPSVKDVEDSRQALLRVNEELTQVNASLEERVAQKTKDVKKNEERLRQVIDSAPNGLVMVGGNGKIVLCNAQIETIFGYAKEEIIGKEIEILVPERFRRNHVGDRRQFLGAPQTRQMGAGRDLYGLRRDGSEFPLEIGLNPMVTDEGTFVLASVVDISKRKVLEDRLRRSTAAMEMKNHEMEQFVYTVSHDLKSPLVTSTGFLGLLKEDLMAQRYDQVMDSITRLERANNRMSQLIDDLLQLSRIGRIKLEIENVDVRGVIQAIVENLSSQLKEKSANVEIPAAMPTVTADRKRIYQVFENLVINALKYACDGADRRITVGFDENSNEVLYFIRDHGPGIAKEYHKKIFGLFQRLENDNRGTGVGLTIVSRIMQLHGGRVWVESSAGTGATFWLSFPKSFVPLATGGDHD